LEEISPTALGCLFAVLALGYVVSEIQNQLNLRLLALI
jgi:hypothetical protein